MLQLGQRIIPMKFNTVFCNDGVLRIKLDKYPLIPATFVQEQYDNLDDLSFWSKWGKNQVIFEQGLTVSNFLSCIEPWVEYFSIITQKDIFSYIQESRKPFLIKNDLFDSAITWVCLNYVTELSACLKDENGQELNKASTLLNGQWTSHENYKLTGYSEGKSQHHSIEHLPLNSICNMPLVLDNKHMFIIEHYNAKKLLGEHYKVFEPDAFGVRSVEFSPQYVVQYFQSDKVHFLHPLVDGFFQSFCENPTQRDKFNQEIFQVYEKTQKQINSFSIFKDNKLDTAEKNNIYEMDFVLDSEEKKKYFWSKLIEKTRQDNTIVLKIGEIKEAVVYEKRLYSEIINEDNS